MDATLKPCPFCGHGGTGCVVKHIGFSVYMMACDRCGAEGPSAKSEAQAKESWNLRGRRDG